MKVKICPCCGGENLVDAKACRWCGYGFEEGDEVEIKESDFFHKDDY